MSIIRATAVCLIVACALGACTQAPLEPVTEEVGLSADEAFVAPTPEMRRAALSGDPEAMADAAAALVGCPAPKTCPGYSSCSAWSASVECSTTCGFPFCSPFDPAVDPGDQDRTLTERFKSYRICSNAMGQSCTE